MDFKKLSERELLQAYRGYKKLATTGTVGEDDFGGVFRRAIDECDSDIGVKVTDTQSWRCCKNCRNDGSRNMIL